MNLPLKIARRYLFAKKSTNAINIISGISVFGISVGTAALILVLSVFNGFEDLLTGLFSSFNPDVKVLPAEGKIFEINPEEMASLNSLKGIEYMSSTLEEVAFFEYKGSQDFGILKGVDQHFDEVTGIDSTIREGQYLLKDGERVMAVLGVVMRNNLSINVDDDFSMMSVYMGKRGKVSALGDPFKKRFVAPVGTFVIQQDFDSRYVLTDLDFVRDLLEYETEISSLEIKLKPEADGLAVINSIKNILGPRVMVKDRYQQDEAFLKLMNVEKWVAFAIVLLMLALILFNMIGALWMIVMDKKKDIAILKSMGAVNSTIRNIFINEGLLLAFLGIFIGFALAILLYLIQKYLGIVPIPAGFVVDAYPISMRMVDFVVVGSTVVVFCFLASIPPAMRASRVSALIRID